MPTFTAITLDRLLEQGGTRSEPSAKLEHRSSAPARAKSAAAGDSGPVSVHSLKPSIPLPPSHPKQVRNSFLSASTENKAQRLRILPALYATPESTPLPGSPISFPPSPYIINHKRRGPRLQKSLSELSVAKDKIMDGQVPDSSHLSDTEIGTQSSSLAAEVVFAEEKVNGFDEKKIGKSVAFEVNSELKDVVGPSSVERESEIEDFFDPQESMSITANTDREDFSADHSARSITPMGVFYDACEELSSDSEHQLQSSIRELESEVHEMRLSLLMEVEKRKQAEEALNNMQTQWQKLREKLREVGLVLPIDLLTVAQDAQMNVDSTEDICQQVYITRFVSETIGRGVARAECEKEMEAQLELKNFEIARLCDRLHYYETMNREMSQRNQEAIELARRDRQKRRRIQRWVWGSILAAMTIGSAALAWSYIPNGKASSSCHQLHASESDTTAD